MYYMRGNMYVVLHSKVMYYYKARKTYPNFMSPEHLLFPFYFVLII